MPRAKKSSDRLRAAQSEIASWARALGDPGAGILAYPSRMPSERAQRAARLLLAGRDATPLDVHGLALTLDTLVPPPRPRRRAVKRAA